MTERKWDCDCWLPYPNERHRNKNGTWKCVDRYECISDLQYKDTMVGKLAVRKTHCRRKRT